ncbi:MAG: ABC transporter permease [Chloroflexota bacterium]|nr:ABC transporter permease [Chloroflexota bacterium]
MGAGAAALIVILVVVAGLARQLAPYDPLEADPSLLRSPPSVVHPLGTDHIGRDVLSRLMHGGRISFLVAVTSVVLGKAVGFSWGVASGYLGGKFDLISQRFLEVLLSFPGIILAILLLSVLGAGLHTVIIAITIGGIASPTRIIRSVVLSVKEMTYVEAARAIGASPIRIMALHVAPQCIAPAMVVFSVSLGAAIFTEAALSFLGLGIPQPVPSWGNMLGGVVADVFKPPWWLVVFPGVTITLTILAFNLLGDALRDYLDPRLRGQLQ